MPSTPPHRLAFAVIAATAVLALSAACSGGSDPSSSTTPAPSTSSAGSPSASGSSSEVPADAVVIDVTLKDGKVTPSGDKIKVSVGQTVLIKVTSDHDDEVHVHSDPGVEIEVKAGEPTQGSFVAQEKGSFEVESHHPHKIIAILNVQ